ncbi:MAG TPA: protein-glutamate O-methyltransferase CheR [Rhizomicrobium sp.]|nr:protein-glutamate O-methyltransferase CheR [Rhizomicrobium sp.]
MLAELLNRRSGLVIGADKARLIESKLAPVARRFGFRNCAEMLGELPWPQEELAEAITEAMTTNESSFFRDRVPFDHFRARILPELCAARAGKKRLRIWCAAAATGQEAYSLAMILAETGLIADGWKVDLIATDLSRAAIARAREGVYSQYEAQRGLSVQTLVENFTQEGTNWRIGERLRRMVSFRSFNLLDHYGWLGDIDVVFCRNVLMYLDAHIKAAVLDRISATLAPDGWLILGAKESAPGWEADAVRGVYRGMRMAAAKASVA